MSETSPKANAAVIEAVPAKSEETQISPAVNTLDTHTPSESVVKGSATAADTGDDAAPEEEVTKGNWVLPQVDIKEIEVVTGEEDEECVWKHRSKLYRWAQGEWKERGLGDSKLLRDKEGKSRFLLRQEKTGKIVANHYVVPQGDFCKLKPNAGSDKCWVWSVLDCADEPPAVQQFALMFGQAENAKKFKEGFENVAEANLKLWQEGKFNA